MARYLSQLLRRVFAFFLLTLHARASLQFCTFCFHNLHRKGLIKRRSFLGRSSDVFLFFSDIFPKMSDFFWCSSQVLGSSCSLQAWHSVKVAFSPFFLVEKPPFSTTACEGCESKKVQIPGNARVCHVRARKSDFF